MKSCFRWHWLTVREWGSLLELRYLHFFRHLGTISAVGTLSMAHTIPNHPYPSYVRNYQSNTASLSLQHQHGTGTTKKSPYATESWPPAQPEAWPSVQDEGCTKHFGGEKLFLSCGKGCFLVSKGSICSCSKTFAPNGWSFSSQKHPKVILPMLVLNNRNQFPLAVQFITHPAGGFLPYQVFPLPTI